MMTARCTHPVSPHPPGFLSHERQQGTSSSSPAGETVGTAGVCESTSAMLKRGPCPSHSAARLKEASLSLGAATSVLSH